MQVVEATGLDARLDASEAAAEAQQRSEASAERSALEAALLQRRARDLEMRRQLARAQRRHTRARRTSPWAFPCSVHHSQAPLRALCVRGRRRACGR